MGYDAAGNLLWSATGFRNLGAGCPDATAVAARRADRSYDPRNRVEALVFPDGQGDTTYEYAADGLLDSIVAHNGTALVTHNYTYNKRRLLTNEQMLFGTINWNVARTYNPNGHLDTETYPGNLTISYLPNALGQAQQAGTYATGVTYHPNGGIATFLYGNEISHRMDQNERGLPEWSIDFRGSSQRWLNDYYDYDQNGNVAAISDALPDHRGDRIMTYDGLNRLTNVESPMWDQRRHVHL